MENTVLFEKNTSGKILYVRHGQTEFNSRMLVLGEYKVQGVPEFVDAGVTQKGIESIQKAAESLSALTIETIYCSPMLRTLQTTYHIFENHPQRESLVVYIHPYVSEKVFGVQDYSFDIAKKKAEYNMQSKVKYNWDIFDSIFKTPIEQELYMFKYCHCNNEGLNALIKQIEDLYLKGDKDEMKIVYGKLGEQLIKNDMKTFESFSHTFKRNIAFKKYLHEKLGKEGTGQDTKNKIVIITHSAFIKMSTTSKAYKTIEDMPTYPDDSYFSDNGEIITINITPEICLKDRQFEL